MNEEILYFLHYMVYVVCGYLLGSILFGYLVPKWMKHIDTLEESDDHNPGTANAFKLGGTICGIIVIVLELLKGFLPVFLASRFIENDSYLVILILVAPVIGHAYPIFYGFKNGGKCIAVSFGVLLGMAPNLLPSLTLAFWFVFFSVILIVNPHALRVIITYICFVFSMVFLSESLSVFIACVLISGIVILRHIKSLKAAEKKEVYFAFRRN